ncbi:MAG: hypothetical protein H0T51_25250 [Pirellulales bacterium]|nr:hypothetical protein [Pirellulales bacterium]
MSPRLKLRAAATPLVMAGAVWATSAWSSIAMGGGAQTPPPCGPDGICVPNAVFGVHITRWRPFPGDVIGKPPTEATKKPEEEGMGGPVLPKATQEGQMGPTRAPRGEGAPGEGPAAEGEEDAAAAGLGTLPGEVPLPGIELPGIGQPAPAPEGGEAPAEGPAAGPQGDPAAEPGADPLDPFGSAPPAPPAWLRNAAVQNRAPGAEAALESLPVVTTAIANDESAPEYASADAAAFVAPGATEPAVMDGPNLHGDDAPPTLPPTLQSGITSVAPTRRVAPPQARVAPGTAPVGIAQPVSVVQVASAAPVAKTASVEPTDDEMVIAASAEEPVGIQLVNPAEALVDPEAEGLQQAIYFEASDQ